MRPTRIPLFPLEVVLFPGMPLPLHIFEQRYRVMVARCVNENLEIGIILAAETGIVKVGCTAEIVEKLKEYPDGRTDILCEGRALFRVIEILNEREYQEAIAEYLVEDVLAARSREGKPSDRTLPGLPRPGFRPALDRLQP